MNMMRYTSAFVVLLILVGCQRDTEDGRPAALPEAVLSASSAFREGVSARHRDDYAIPRKLLPLLKTGMPEAEVEALLGKPDEIRKTDRGTSWSYTLFYSMFIDVQFDERQSVVRIDSPLLAQDE